MASLDEIISSKRVGCDSFSSSTYARVHGPDRLDGTARAFPRSKFAKIWGGGVGGGGGGEGGGTVGIGTFLAGTLTSPLGIESRL